MALIGCKQRAARPTTKPCHADVVRIHKFLVLENCKCLKPYRIRWLTSLVKYAFVLLNYPMCRVLPMCMPLRSSEVSLQTWVIPFSWRTIAHVPGYGHGILLVAEGSKGIEGFVGGFPAVVGLRQHIWRRKWRFIVPVCVAVLRHPRLWKRIVQRCYDVMSTRKQVVTSTTKEARQKSMNEYELSPVAVNPKFAGRGRGQLLVREFIRAASSLGAESVYLNTDAEDNERVNVFYRKLGFELKRTFVMDGQRPME